MASKQNSVKSLSFFSEAAVLFTKTHEIVAFNEAASRFLGIGLKKGGDLSAFLNSLGASEALNAPGVELAIDRYRYLYIASYDGAHHLLLVRLTDFLDQQMDIFGPDILKARELFELIPGNVYWMDTERRYLGCNQSNVKAIGFKHLSEILGRRIEDLYPDLTDVLRDVIEKDKQVLRTGREVIFEELGYDQDGIKTTYLTIKMPVKNAKAKVLGLLGISFEIGRFLQFQRPTAVSSEHWAHYTERQRSLLANLIRQIAGVEASYSEGHLVDSVSAVSLFYESVLACFPGSLYWKDRNGNYLGCNDVNASLFGLKSRYDMVGLRLEDILEGERLKSIQAVDEEVMSTGRAIIYEEKGHSLDEEKAVYMTYKVPIFGHKDKVVGMVGISLDITQRKKAEAALKRAKAVAEKANQAKSDFLAMMTHELRTPLNIILGMTRILESEKLSPERQAHFLSTIFNSGQALLHLINNILDFSKAQSGTLHLQEEVFSPQETLAQIEAELSHKAAEKELYFKLETKDLPDRLLGDEQRLRQVLYNLTDNALKYTEKGGVTVRLSTRMLDAKKLTVVVDIEDTGIGIPKSRLKQVFRAFDQVRSDKHDQYSRKHGGVGLGLAIVKKMVAVLKGELSIDSEEGVGTRFHIEMPMQFADQTDSEQKISEAILPEAFPGTKILLVEDNLMNQKVVVHMLKGLQCEVDAAASGEEALKKLKSDVRYDLVLMDISLPDMSGLEITKIYRDGEGKKRGDRLPIMALTAHAHSDDEKRCRKAGMDDFLVKPVFPEKLREIIYRYSRNK